MNSASFFLNIHSSMEKVCLFFQPKTFLKIYSIALAASLAVALS